MLLNTDFLARSHVVRIIVVTGRELKWNTKIIRTRSVVENVDHVIFMLLMEKSVKVAFPKHIGTARQSVGCTQCNTKNSLLYADVVNIKIFMFPFSMYYVFNNVLKKITTKE